MERHFSTPQKTETFLHKEGALWFGDKTVSTNEGNIKAANAVITQINSSAQGKDERVESLYMDKIMEGTPSFMKAFKPHNPTQSAESEWDKWSALYQPDGGSVDMKASYNAFLQDAKNHGTKIYDGTKIESYEYHPLVKLHTFKALTLTDHQVFSISGKKILITTGVFTPFFLKNVMNEPYLANNAKDEFVLQEYVASYFKINPAEA